MNKLISVVIVNYNNTNDTINCLKSLQNQSYKNYEVILFDNGSNYNSYIELKKKVKSLKKNIKIKLYRNKINSFFASGNNKAIKMSNGDYICLLNNDTLVSDKFLEAFVNFYDRCPKVGMTSPKIKVIDNSDYIWYAGASLNYKSGNIAKLRGFWEYDQLNKKYTKIIKTDYATGTALFLKRDLIKKIGFMDEIFFMYYEETDWNLRARKKGYINYFLPTVIIYHKVPLYKSKQSLFKWFFMNRNSQIVVWKHAQVNQLFYFYIQFLKKNLLYFYKELRNSRYYTYIQLFSIYQGFRIGLKRRLKFSCKKNIVKDFKFISENQKRMQNLLV